MRSLIRYWETKPLEAAIILAAVLRLIAAVFSRGYGMHDDHFLVIEPAQAWVDGVDYNAWLPAFHPGASPSGHSLLYPGLHYLLFSILNVFGITDPEWKMFVVRLLHAIYSLLTVFFAYKIVRHFATERIASLAALLMAMLWFMPFLSVRNLVEVVCIPLLMAGTWLSIKSARRPLLSFFLAGIMLGLAFSVRYQSILFTAGLLLALLIKRQWREALISGAGVIFSAAVVQGGIDYFIWGIPFAEFREYVLYNFTHASSYIVNAWYMYLLLLLGILIPPISVFLLSGFFLSWKKYLLLFLPSFLFLLFHSIFPNKQERFILPVLPFIVIGGLISWNEIKTGFMNQGKRNQFIRGSWIFFWIVNLVFLMPVTTMYSKTARVESMLYLSSYPGIGGVLLEDSGNAYAPMIPEFYLGQWVEVSEISQKSPLAEYEQIMVKDGDIHQPRFVLFFGDKDLDKRVQRLQQLLPALSFEKEIRPGLVDRVLFWLNPVNANQTIYIYRNIQQGTSQIQ
ncbi:MAG TPA: glycosyltransferase family 39 protein [Bacteroidales bacterium]|nr:glycosyltransferase family 39 protein [Bacteroidales bacterium]HSA42659.1 glycosyltransferase family 39 protein [Bacteroidales bacterium]